MQNAIDRMLEDARRQLAVPVLNFSVLFPDDLLADSVAHQSAANPRTSRSGASSLEDYNSSYSADQEDETEEDDGLVSLSPAPSSPACSATLVIDAVTIPVSPVQLSPSSRMDDRTSDKEQDDAESMVEDIGYGIDNVWEELATYVPRLLTRTPEESLADEFWLVR
ncbi:hypothetical protein JVT61DRAFT_13802 [Boletus reticuloceps]|uniref:Uncharacterized protein n=1 Tax=Boletus reticuloceps TaxID=495285 RepID=A0A8I2YV01_9AGAM|nr:hypothetical protein JVT61DRAFT_13802 [Boletus reticuloceps]